MLHWHIYYSFKRLPYAFLSKSTEAMNPLGRWTIRRTEAINTYLASLDHENGSVKGVRYCKTTSKKLLSASQTTSNNHDDSLPNISLVELFLTDHRL